MNPFIHPYQYNVIRRELNKLLNAVYFVGDYRSYAAVKQTTVETIKALFMTNPDVDFSLFDGIEGVNGQKELNVWMERFKPYVIPFPKVTDGELKKMFRKAKRFSAPDVTEEHRQFLTYLGWRDISTHTLFLVYPLQGQMHGLMCRYTVGTKTNVCCLCGGSLDGRDVGLVVTNTRAANYQSIGNYMCLDSDACNARLTDITSLESFVYQAVHGR